MTRNDFLEKYAIFLFVLITGSSNLQAESRFITIASTTSTENSGFYEYLLPRFASDFGVDVRVVAVGTGKAIKIAEKGDADVLLVHHKPSEEKFVTEGFGIERYDVMYNDFVIVGPPSDPAGIGGSGDAAASLRKIADRGAKFASRGDNSGTHKKETALWETADVDPTAASGDWYRETGSGMGATLNAAVGMGAYTMTDRGTWISFKNKGDYTILVEGDDALFNQYGVILVNPAKHDNVKAEAGQMFIDWIIGPQGQAAIAAYTLDGQQLFFPNAQPR